MPASHGFAQICLEEAMAIAITLKCYLEKHHVEYDMVKHIHSETATESAHSANVPGHQVAKAVVLEDADGYVVSVLPSTNRLDLDWVNETLGRELELAHENELSALFQDCATGAVPALSNAYGLDVIWDDQLRNVSDIYIEAGDHHNLVHMRGESFRKLLEKLPHSVISAEKDFSRWMDD
jgi:Ala-tRNA(Pro) deacylase